VERAWQLVREVWPHAVSAVAVALALFASGHAILRKRDVRSAVGWVAVIWGIPIGGAALYLTLGVNRIARRAGRLRPSRLHAPAPALPDHVVAPDALPPPLVALAPLARLVGNTTGLPLLSGNRVTPLDGGRAAYDAMVAAIDAAERSVVMSTYIFDTDAAGERFVRALGAAAARGAEVRVLVDGVGANYSRPTVLGRLRRAGVRARAFLSPAVPWHLAYANMRNHRKVLVVDGRVGFTGGMNIRAGCLAPADDRRAISDLHFRVEGPVVAQLVDTFAEDWAFTTRETLPAATHHPPLESTGEVLARAVPDGPDENIDKLRWTLLGALAQARCRAAIVTPYFLPDAALQGALCAAALRGVVVDVVLPARNNLRIVQWAQTAELWTLLERGVRVWLTPPPFDHAKIFVVDGLWSCIGSSNWDPRSLRLNFELNLECYDAALAVALTARVDARIARARRFTLDDWRARPLPLRLRDGIARLFSPYL
jgi:cardiolipin synthase